MQQRVLFVVLGSVLFLAGGAILALFRGVEGMIVGTTVALTGVVVAAWGWMERRDDRE